MKREFRQFQFLTIVSLVFYMVIMLSDFSGFDAFDKVIVGTFVLLNLSLIMQALFLVSAYRSGRLSSVFYRFPLMKIGFFGLIGMIVMIFVVLFIPDFPLWIGALGCTMIALITELISIQVKKRAEYIEFIDEKIAASTDFIHSMTIASKALIQKADSQVIKKECEKVYEAFRYSDPMSTEEMIVIEERIRNLFSSFIEAVKKSESEQVRLISNEIKEKIQERNSKLLKAK